MLGVRALEALYSSLHAFPTASGHEGASRDSDAITARLRVAVGLLTATEEQQVDVFIDRDGAPTVDLARLLPSIT